MAIPSLNSTLSPISFYILLAVADHPVHTYGIRDQIAHDSESQLVIATGTLYPAITRLVAEGLLERTEASSPTIRVTHCFRITPWGQRKLASEARRYSRLALHARLKLGEKIF